MNGIHEVVGSIPVASKMTMNNNEIPDVNTLIGEEDTSGQEEPEASIPKAGFSIPEKIQEEPKPCFRDRDYYKKVLAREGNEAKKFHENITLFLKSKSVADRSILRDKATSTFWALASSIASKVGEGLAMPKRMFLRFGILSPTFITKEQRDMISRVIFENATGEPVHYIDEWLMKISRGSENPSATDETKKKAKDDGQKQVEKLDKQRGKRDAELLLLRNRVEQLEDLEAQLQEQVGVITEHEIRSEYEGLKDSFSEFQKQALSEISKVLRQLSTVNRTVSDSYRILERLDEELESLSEYAEGIDESQQVDREIVVDELNSIRQMAKMCVGKQGNHFPILMSQYLGMNIKELGIRENVIREMANVEACDPELFYRTYKSQTNRIVPHVFLISCYGDRGICWEPFEKYNRATSRGRISIPMYPKKLKTAVISALADLRWLVAKEKAQYRWMEEGLTGHYYQWFEGAKIKGDVKESFARDYALWITAESQGMQKLNREVRAVFWRNLPFPQEIKEKLKNRGFVYSELYDKDQNIARSDGY